ncbi:hypothetical protein CANCADRAFT_56616 [Tortispora caseinolytica NRRL Y-17796]|uniref:Stress-associated endoplasmic reticulum protein n=1 Tax=Tortispora caseinolytica NRRL Y-17796 TaxID=767744 RepID=A0A1E4TE12_9ASCO|nr:hypothetical protein CANCADRAFT_56616 [Tortispora caseinolytica NRRL Y-17796]
MAPQTPTQRKANLKYAKSEAAKMGKPKSSIHNDKRQVSYSPAWIIFIVFLACGGIALELFSMIYNSFR